jgi:hypothetical protein
VNQVNLYQQPPTGYTPAQMRGGFNNAQARALASGDMRANMKGYDRAGFSRGMGQKNQAGIAAGQSVIDGLQQAYRGAIGDQLYNANMALDGRVGQEAFGQALGGLQQQQAYQDQLNRLQYMSSLLGGLLS